MACHTKQILLVVIVTSPSSLKLRRTVFAFFYQRFYRYLESLVLAPFSLKLCRAGCARRSSLERRWLAIRSLGEVWCALVDYLRTFAIEFEGFKPFAIKQMLFIYL